VTCDGCSGLASAAQCPVASQPAASEACDWEWTYGDSLGPCDPAAGTREYPYNCTSTVDGVVDPAEALCPNENDDSTTWTVYQCDWEWAVGTFSSCDPATGGKTRTVACSTDTDGLGTIATDLTLCSAAKPASYSACSWTWTMGSWSTCVNGTYSRNVGCGLAAGLGSPASAPTDATCTTYGAGAKPATSGACGFKWKLGSWSACTQAGTRTRNVSCTTQAGAPAAAASCGAKPATAGTCTYIAP